MGPNHFTRSGSETALIVTLLDKFSVYVWKKRNKHTYSVGSFSSLKTAKEEAERELLTIKKVKLTRCWRANGPDYTTGSARQKRVFLKQKGISEVFYIKDGGYVDWKCGNKWEAGFWRKGDTDYFDGLQYKSKTFDSENAAKAWVEQQLAKKPRASKRKKS